MVHKIFCLFLVVLRSEQTITANLCERAVLRPSGTEQNPRRLVDPVGVRELPPVVPSEPARPIDFPLVYTRWQLGALKPSV